MVIPTRKYPPGGGLCDCCIFEQLSVPVIPLLIADSPDVSPNLSECFLGLFGHGPSCPKAATTYSFVVCTCVHV